MPVFLTKNVQCISWNFLFVERTVTNHVTSVKDINSLSLGRFLIKIMLVRYSLCTYTFQYVLDCYMPSLIVPKQSAQLDIPMSQKRRNTFATI